MAEEVEELLNRLEGKEMTLAEVTAYNYLVDSLDEEMRTGSLEESRLFGLCVDLLEERYPK